MKLACEDLAEFKVALALAGWPNGRLPGTSKDGLVRRRLAQMGDEGRCVGSVFPSVRVLTIGVLPRSCDFYGDSKVNAVFGMRVARARRRSFEITGGEVVDESRGGRIENLVTTDASVGAEYRESDDGERKHQGKEDVEKRKGKGKKNGGIHVKRATMNISQRESYIHKRCEPEAGRRTR